MKFWLMLFAAWSLAATAFSQGAQGGPGRMRMGMGMRDRKPLGAWHYGNHRAFLLSFVAQAPLALMSKALSEGAKIDAPIENEEGKPFDPRWSPLYYAVFAGDKIPLVNFLIQHHANVEFKSRLGVSVLWLAATSGSVPAVKALLDNGANPNQKNPQGKTLVAQLTEMHAKHDFKNHYAQMLELLKLHGAKS